MCKCPRVREPVQDDKRVIHQEDLSVLNINASNNKVPN